MKRTSLHIKNMWIKQLCNHVLIRFSGCENFSGPTRGWTNVPVKLKLQHPPRVTPREFEFLENFWSNSPLPRPKSCSNAPSQVHSRWSNAPTPGKPFGSFYYAPEAVYVNIIPANSHALGGSLGVSLTPAGWKLRSHADSRLRANFSRLIEKCELLPSCLTQFPKIC